jgi:tRNA dimethylallyltransferase
MSQILPKIIAIVGPTASGKTDLGVALAKKFQGEIIAADSRTVYKYMDIATAKPKGETEKDEQGREYRLADGIRHYGFDLVDPGKTFTVAEYKDYAVTLIKEIIARGHLPILVGGTGFYIRAVVDNLEIPRIAPNKKMRASFENKTLSELVTLLKDVDPVGATEVDLKNKRRVMRALEVSILSGKAFSEQKKKGPVLFEALVLGLMPEREVLYQRIDERVEKQFEAGLVEETKKLVKRGYPWSLPSMSGIGYKEVGEFLRGEIDLARAKEKIKFRTHDYARRQITWFKKEKNIRWVADKKAAEKLVSEFTAK